MSKGQIRYWKQKRLRYPDMHWHLTKIQMLAPCFSIEFGDVASQLPCQVSSPLLSWAQGQVFQLMFTMQHNIYIGNLSIMFIAFKFQLLFSYGVIIPHCSMPSASIPFIFIHITFFIKLTDLFREWAMHRCNFHRRSTGSTSMTRFCTGSSCHSWRSRIGSVPMTSEYWS